MHKNLVRLFEAGGNNAVVAYVLAKNEYGKKLAWEMAWQANKGLFLHVPDGELSVSAKWEAGDYTPEKRVYEARIIIGTRSLHKATMLANQCQIFPDTPTRGHKSKYGKKIWGEFLAWEQAFMKQLGIKLISDFFTKDREK